VSISVCIALVLLVSVAACIDARSRRIPNGLNATAFVLGLTLSIQADGLAGFWNSIQGFALAFGVYLALYLFRAMGAGDVKLMAAIGSLVGPANWLTLLLFVSVAGAVMALIAVTIRGRLRDTVRNTYVALAELIHLRVPAARYPQLDISSGVGFSLPHAVPIAVGTFVFVAVRITQ
jgi:prepilin peptidase CpaA